MEPAKGVAVDPSIGIEDETDFDPEDSAEDRQTVFVFATDYQSSGQLYAAQIEDGVTVLTNSGVTLLGTEATVRLHEGLLYVLHAGAMFNSVSSDNLQIIDPYDPQHPFKTLNQFSTGNGTNPRDCIIEGNRAFISLYNPGSDPDNIDSNGDPADVIEMNTNTGEIPHRYSFAAYLNDDGDQNGSAYKMLIVNNTLYVLLQDLQSTFTANSNGLVGMIDVNEHHITGTIKMQGRNPSALAASDDMTRLFVSHTADYSFNTSYGGIEVINIEAQTTELFIHDSGLGGYVEYLKPSGDKIFAVLARYDISSFTFESKIVSFPQDLSDSSAITTFQDYATDIRDIHVHPPYLWASYRVISTSEGDANPAIKVFNIETKEQVGETLTPIVAGVSITGE
ncbi:MAG: hypothetical protein HQM16_00485 [Deltaproteobacteria bacterium]|nr:hypothetical protein [Deltaproteobacteria bacterium]